MGNSVTYTDTQKVATLLGSIPPKLDRKREKAWVLLTFPHVDNLSTHSKFTLALPNPLSPPFPSPSPLAPFHPYRMISTVKYVRVHLTKIRCSSVTYVTQHGISTAFSHPLSLFHMESGNVPYASCATFLPQTATLHLRLPSPILNFDSD